VGPGRQSHAADYGSMEKQVNRQSLIRKEGRRARRYLNITDEAVEIRAESRKETEEKREGYVRRERSARTFHRYVALPTAVDPDQAEAHLEDGILRIELPKRVPTRTRKVPVG